MGGTSKYTNFKHLDYVNVESGNSWSAQDTVTVSPTGVSAISSVGDGTNMGVPHQGWGVDAWNTGGSWGQANDENSVELTGLSITASVGTPIASAATRLG